MRILMVIQHTPYRAVDVGSQGRVFLIRMLIPRPKHGLPPAPSRSNVSGRLPRSRTFLAPAERSDLAMRNMEYEIKNEDIEALLKELGSDLKKRMPAGWGFNLLIFSYGEGGSMFYLSSAQRNDMLKAMREFIDKFEVRQ